MLFVFGCRLGTEKIPKISNNDFHERQHTAVDIKTKINSRRLKLPQKDRTGKNL